MHRERLGGIDPRRKKKKLEEAARHWAEAARGGGGKDEAADDLRSYGLSDAEVREILGEDERADVVCLWPENAAAVDLFLALQTQWRAGPLGGVLGLDYQGVAALFRMKRVRNQPAMLDDIRVMEGAALRVLNQKRQS